MQKWEDVVKSAQDAAVLVLGYGFLKHGEAPICMIFSSCKTAFPSYDSRKPYALGCSIGTRHLD